MVTLRDVAAAAGVSTASVSYAYSRPEKLSEAQRSHILDVASRLGYAGPHPGAASLRTGHVGAIGLMITDTLPYAFEDPATALLLRGIAQVGELAEVALTFLPLPPGGGDASGHDEARLARQVLVDGFLVYSMPEGHPAIAAARARGLPLVVIDSPAMPGVPFVGIDDAAGADTAAQHLLELGHREFVVLIDRLAESGPARVVDRSRATQASYSVGQARLTAYLDALERAGIGPAQITVIEAGGFLVSEARLAAELALECHGTTAVLASTDLLALTFLDLCRERGLSVPGQVSIVGYDNVPAAAVVNLTTIQQPLQDKGRVAAEMLLKAMKGKLPRRRILPTELILGTTTSVPGAGLP